MREAFGQYLPGASTQFVEPPWKAILSNKGILPLLWSMFPGHPNLLPAYFDDDEKAAELGASYARKPLYSREGANIDLVVAGNTVDQRLGPLRRRRVRAPGAGAAAAVRRQLHGPRLLDRCRTALRAVGARGREPDHQEFIALPAARHRRVGGLHKSLLQLPHLHCPSCRAAHGLFRRAHLSGPDAIKASTAIPPVLKIVFLVVFASTLFSRVVDPVVPQIAADLLVDVKTAALLSTAFTLPYALTQPVLGTIADFFGKTRLMNMSLLIVSITALICAVATSFSLVFAMRVAAGLVAGGVFPVAMALVGDLVPIHQRQVMIGRLLAVGLTGNVLGAAIAGVIGDLFGWRGIFAVIGAFGLIITVAAFYILRSFPVPKPRPAFNLAAVKANYRSIFADPRAKFCFGSVFFEGIFIHGIFPYVAILLLASGEARASIAGLVIAAFGLGGVIYSLSVPALVDRFAERRLMLIGGALAAIGAHPRGPALSLVRAGRGLRHVRVRLLPAARLHPGARHRPVDDRARRGDLRCIRASSSSGRRPGRSSTASAMRMAALNR